MRVTLTIDLADRTDTAMRDEALGWLHCMTRSPYTVTEVDDEETEGWTSLTFEFRDPLDAHDFRSWYGLRGRARVR